MTSEDPKSRFNRPRIYSPLDRRRLLTSSLVAGSALAMPFVSRPAWAQESDNAENNGLPETEEIKISHNRDISSSPFYIARSLGFTDANKIKIDLTPADDAREAIERLNEGRFHVAVLPACQPLIELFKQEGSSRNQLIVPFVMNLNGGAITVRPSLYHDMVEANRAAMEAPRPTRALSLISIVNERRKKKLKPLRFGVTERDCEHELMLRYWLAEGGVNPSEDIEFVAMNGPALVASLKAQAIDGFMSLDPWCSHAIKGGFGYAIVTAREIWSNAPGAILATTVGWAERNPNSLRALLRSLIPATSWCDQLANRRSLIERMSKRSHINAPKSILANSLAGNFGYIDLVKPIVDPDFVTYHRYASNFPWRSDAVWYLSQMARWGIFEDAFDLRRVALSVFRPDIFRDAVASISEPAPRIDFRTEGNNFGPFVLEDATDPLVMGSDAFIDGRVYNPAAVVDYLGSFDIHAMKIDLTTFKQING